MSDHPFPIHQHISQNSGTGPNAQASAVISIEKGIPMPPAKGRGVAGGRPEIYPWNKMKIGDSFLFPALRDHRSAYSAAYQATKNSQGKKFQVRKTSDGYRCWRVA